MENNASHKPQGASDLKERTCIVFDTETTGMDPEEGHRVIEIGAVKYKNSQLDSRFHVFVDPERDVDPEATKVHGWDLESLQINSGGRKFRDIAKDLIEFCEGGTLIAHNAPFDIKFLNSEYERLGYGERYISKNFNVLDTFNQYSKLIRPRQKNDLDTLCRVYKVDNGRRDLHGALLDAELLADVFFEMVSPQNDRIIKKQNNSALKVENPPKEIVKDPIQVDPGVMRKPSQEEVERHQTMSESFNLTI